LEAAAELKSSPSSETMNRSLEVVRRRAFQVNFSPSRPLEVSDQDPGLAVEKTSVRSLEVLDRCTRMRAQAKRKPHFVGSEVDSVASASR
jgi:hypothetical protein